MGEKTKKEKKKGRKMSSNNPDYVAYAYAALVATGGIMGYVKKGSLMSGAMGLAFGGLMALGAYQTSADRNNFYLSMGISGTLTAIMGKRYLASGALMPAGLVAAMSLAMSTRYALRAVNGPSNN